jgi:hypothetical protein
MTMLDWTGLRKIPNILWAAPYSSLGLTIGLLSMLRGGSGRFRDCALEFYGGPTAWLVRHLPTGPSTLAITLGQLILGQSAAGLEACGRHERVHVAQFERWGLLMGPAYLLASLAQWCRGRDAYWDNPFEIEAYRAAPISTDASAVTPPA